MESIRSVVTEGAKEKTADGMTKDAKNFRADLHTIKDSGMKHLVQKDSETKDYEKMFNGGVDHAKARLSDQQTPEDLNKYVEYNEHLEIEEAKAKEEEHEDDCECEDCSSDDVKEDTVSEIYAQPGTPAGNAYQKTLQGNAGKPALPLQAGQNLTGFGDGGANSRGRVVKTMNTYKPPAPAAASTVQTPNRGTRGFQGRFGSAVDSPSTTNLKARTASGDIAPRPQPGANKLAADQAAKKAAETAFNTANKSGSKQQMAPDVKIISRPQMSPTLKAQQDGNITDKRPAGQQPGSQPPVAGSRPSFEKTGRGGSPSLAPPPKPKLKPAVAPAQQQAAPAQQKQKQAAPAQPAYSARQRRDARIKLDKGDVAGPEVKKLQAISGLGVKTAKTYVQPARPKVKAPAGTNPLRQSFEIDVDGTSYLVSEAHAAAIAAFVEKYGEINEGTAGEFISKEMEHPEKLTAKGKKQKIKQSLAIYYSKKRRGENP
jgi:hypothetical protein